jgi:hypothetical protein
MFGRRAAPVPPAEQSLATQLLELLGPLEPHACSPLAVLLCALCWELLYRASQLACRALAPVLVRSDYSKGAKAFRNHGATYVCAFVHAVLTGGRGIWHVWQLLGAPLDVKLAVPDAGSPHYAAAAATELTNLLFLSWLIYDTVHVLSSYPVRRPALGTLGSRSLYRVVVRLLFRFRLGVARRSTQRSSAQRCAERCPAHIF